MWSTSYTLEVNQPYDIDKPRRRIGQHAGIAGLGLETIRTLLLRFGQVHACFVVGALAATARKHA